jgi:hypothetical protein
MESSEQGSITSYDNGKQTLTRYQDVLAVFNRLRLKLKSQFRTGFFLQIFKMLTKPYDKKRCT